MTEREVFLKALEIEDSGERAALLHRLGDADLRRRVEALLKAHDEAGGFLRAPHPAAGAEDQTGAYVASASSEEKAGATIAGRYKLLERIGEGGMGAVWMADQLEPVKRRVAVKLIRSERDGSASILSRFEAERQAIALMDHPNIAKLLDAGKTESGAPFFVMELVKGSPLTEFCDEHRLSVAERLNLFIQICSAVQHAHQKGIIHRDLKPTNILVEMHDDKPVPKVIDFGLAKAMSGQPLTERTLFTGFGTVAGTPLYMAPEQAKFNAVDVDTRADVYALGVILYELLTGSTPIERATFKQAALDEMLRVIRESEPPTPSKRLSSSDAAPSIAASRQSEPAKLGSVVRGELDWIVMKALSKERDRRYETANGFAKDVERFLNHEPVQAGPPTASYRLRKFVQRNRGQVIATSLLLFTLLLGVIGTSIGFFEAKQSAVAERTAKLKADQEKENALQSAAAEKQANERAQRRLKQIEKSNSVLASIFDDVNIANAKSGVEPLEAMLAKQLVKAGKQLDGDAVGDPVIVATLQFQLGWALRSLGFENEAIPLFVASRDTFTSILGADHRLTIACTGRLASCYLRVGKVKTAVPMQENNYRLSKVALGADDIDTLHSAHTLARCYRYSGELEKALPLIEETMNLSKVKQGIDRHMLLDIADEMISCYHNAGRPDLVLVMSKEQLERCKEVFGPTNRNTLLAMRSLGVSYLYSQNRDMALPLLEETQKLQEDLLGRDHPDTLGTIAALAGAYWQAKRLERSIPLFEKVLKIQEAKLSRRHHDTLCTIANLGVNYKDAGRLAESLPLLEEAYTASRLNAQLRWVGMSLLEAYVQVGKPQQASALSKELLADVRLQLPDAGPILAGQLASFGFSLLQIKAFAEAESLLRECLVIREKSEPTLWTTFNSKSMLGATLLGQKKYADAEPLLLKGYEGMKQREKTIPPAGKIRLPEAIDRLIELYTALNKPEEVKKWKAERAKYPDVAPNVPAKK